MATIREIAELAGVSRGTVDRVLNNRGSVNAATAALVRDIAARLDYKPNPAGIALAAQRKNVKLGVLLFDTKNPFFEDVWKGVLEKEEELAGYNCTVLKKKRRLFRRRTACRHERAGTGGHRRPCDQPL